MPGDGLLHLKIEKNLAALSVVGRREMDAINHARGRGIGGFLWSENTFPKQVRQMLLAVQRLVLNESAGRAVRTEEGKTREDMDGEKRGERVREREREREREERARDRERERERERERKRRGERRE